MRRALAVPVAVALLVAPAAYAGAPTVPVYDAHGRVIRAPLAPAKPPVRLTQGHASAIFLSDPKVRDWLTRYPTAGRTVDSVYSAKYANWTIKVWWGKAGEIATGKVGDASGVVTEAWTGPQVAWKMARGYKGAFGGAKINSPWVWGIFCLVFLLGLADFRRLLSVRNLDLLMLLSPTASLWFFNHGDVFTAVPLFYPALVWVVLRGVWIGATGRGSRARTLWPAWVLLAAAVFLSRFRIGLNVQAPNVIDVGYSGVIGAERIVHGQAPWGNFPTEDDLKACGPADVTGEIRER